MAEELKGWHAILGQGPAVEWLRRAWKSNRLPHGFIFAGPVGVGKATTARALATLFLCQRPFEDEPCGSCDACGAMAGDRHPDFHLIYRQLRRLEKENVVAKELAVDVIRQFLIAPATLKPMLGRGRVFVVEEAHLMNTYAQNSLLKTLEEPAGRAIIVLLTDQPDSLLPTIRSRCQTLRFVSLNRNLVRDELIRRGHDPRLSEDAARIADGSLGRAIQWLADGVVERSAELFSYLDKLEGGESSVGFAEWLKASAESYANKQLERDPQASKDQATREGLAIYLGIMSDHLRAGLVRSTTPEAIERATHAIDELVRAEQLLDANVNIALVTQNLALQLTRSAISSA